MEFIGVERAESPLYGRYHAEIRLERFSREQSLDLLEKGFREEGYPATREIIMAGVNLFDGIVGWLVFYGRTVIDSGRDPQSIYSIAVRLAEEELDKLSPREKIVLKAVAHGCTSWSCVRDYVSERLGETIPKSSLSRIIRKLEKLSIIRDYVFLDPVYREAAKK